MNKTIRLNKRTLLTLEFPEIKIKSNTISLFFQNNLYIQWFPYDNFKTIHIKNNSLKNTFYNVDFELCLLGFGIAVETIINKNKLDVIVESAKTNFNKFKKLAH